MPGLAWRAKRNGGALESTGNFYTNPGSAGISPLALSTLGLVMDAGDIWANAEHCAAPNWVLDEPFPPIRYADLDNENNPRILFRTPLSLDWDIPFSISMWAKDGGGVYFPSPTINQSGGLFYVLAASPTVIQGGFNLRAEPSQGLTGTWLHDGSLIDDWHNLSITYDGSGLLAGYRYYLDGEEQAFFDTQDTLGATPFVYNAMNIELYGGKIANLGTYTAQLSASDVAAILADGPNGSLTDLSSAASLNHYYPLQINSLDAVGNVDGEDTRVEYLSEPSPGTQWIIEDEGD